MTPPPVPRLGADVLEEVTVGLDVGGTKVLGLAVDGSGRVLAETRVPTPTDAGLVSTESSAISHPLIGALASVAERLWAEIGVDVSAVGVGAPGLVDNQGVLRFAPNLPEAGGLPIAAALTTRLAGVRTVVDNDATCATVGEWAYGAAAGADDAVMVTLGTGIGGGVIAGGRVVRGASGFAGEVGHMVVDPNGPLCPCSKRGCWERFASGSGLGRLAREAAHAGRLTDVVHMAGGDAEAVRGDHVTAAALDGDPEALVVLQELGWWLALGLSNLALALDPSVMVVGGGLVRAVRLVLDSVRDDFEGMLEGRAHRPPVRIVPAELGEHAGAIGAAVVARSADRHPEGVSR